MNSALHIEKHVAVVGHGRRVIVLADIANHNLTRATP